MGVREVLGPQPLSFYAQDVVHELEHHLMDIGGNDPPGPKVDPIIKTARGLN